MGEFKRSEGLKRISPQTFRPLDFVREHLLANEPCLFSAAFTAHWEARQKWVLAIRKPLKNEEETNNDASDEGETQQGQPNWEHLIEQFGDQIVPVLVASSSSPRRERENGRTDKNDDEGEEEEEQGDCCYQQMPFAEFVSRFLQEQSPNSSSLKTTPPYLKDWHLQSKFPDRQFYDPPTVLASLDWINAKRWWRDRENPFGGDYKFVYVGPRGSWTPFHMDVMGSFSWSANVCGRKRWLLMKPGAEQYFSLKSGGGFLRDIRKRPEVFAEAGVIEFVQGPGEIVFVPSGWYHQVHNLDDAISINHNVVNAFNIGHVFRALTARLSEVRAEIADIEALCTASEFEEKCQEILLLDFRLNSVKLGALLDAIVEDRRGKLAALDDDPSDAEQNDKRGGGTPGDFLISENKAVDEERVKRQLLERLKTLKCTCSCQGGPNGGEGPCWWSQPLCPECTRALYSFDLAMARAIQRQLL